MERGTSKVSRKPNSQNHFVLVPVCHFSNTTESIKLIHEIISPYVERGRCRLDSEGQLALLIIDIFRVQMTQPVLDLLKESDILLVRVPANMKHIFQPLDLTVNRSAKLLRESL